MIRQLLTAVCLVALSTAPVIAAPSLFVRSSAGSSWWGVKMEGRIFGKAAGPVTVEELTTYIEQNQIYNTYSVCALEPIQNETFVGIDRKAQEEIEAYRPMMFWRIEATTPNGRKVVGQSVVFESCGGDDPKGGALLVTDATTGEILSWQPLGDRFVGETSYPAWAMFLHPREAGGDDLFSYSGCLECGDRTYVYFDVTRKRVYTEDNGH